jgi:hypothetical protein
MVVAANAVIGLSLSRIPAPQAWAGTNACPFPAVAAPRSSVHLGAATGITGATT